MDEKKVIEITQDDLLDFMKQKGYDTSGYKYVQFQGERRNTKLIVSAIWSNQK